MDSTEFSLTYDGEQLHAEPMSAKTLAPVLAATAELFETIHRNKNPMDSRVAQVKVQSAKPGSFNIVFDTVLANADTAVDMLNHPVANAIANLQACVATLGGVVVLFKNLTKPRGQEEPVPFAEMRENDALQRLCDQIAKKPSVKRNVKEIVRPVTQDGIDSVEIRASAFLEPVQVNKREALRIVEMDDDEDDITVEMVNMILTVNTPQLDKPLARKWLVQTEEGHSFRAKLLDEDFAADVLQSKVRFTHSAQFRARVRVETTKCEGQAAKTTYEIFTMTPIGDSSEGQYGIDFNGEDKAS